VAAAVIGPQRPQRAAGSGGGDRAPGLRSITEGFSYLRGRQVLQGAYLIDINATVFGMPKAVFPALAATVFGGGATTLGFLYAAPGAGALLGAVTTGWIPRVRRQGRAVVLAVIVWGAAIAGFGLVHLLPVALVLLAVAGWADVLSAVFRNTIIQVAAPDDLRGRLMGLQMAAVTAGPRMGDVEAGAVANAFGAATSVVSGGAACIVGALALARLLPAFRRQEAPAPQDAVELAPPSASVSPAS
jgi:predicted MFS family arabinose efflux permease